MSNTLDKDQDRHSVGPGPVPNCLQSLSAHDKVAAIKERIKHVFFVVYDLKIQFFGFQSLMKCLVMFDGFCMVFKKNTWLVIFWL